MIFLDELKETGIGQWAQKIGHSEKPWSKSSSRTACGRSDRKVDGEISVLDWMHSTKLREMSLTKNETVIMDVNSHKVGMNWRYCKCGKWSKNTYRPGALKIAALNKPGSGHNEIRLRVRWIWTMTAKGLYELRWWKHFINTKRPTWKFCRINSWADYYAFIL